MIAAAIMARDESSPPRRRYSPPKCLPPNKSDTDVDDPEERDDHRAVRRFCHWADGDECAGGGAAALSRSATERRAGRSRRRLFAAIVGRSRALLVVDVASMGRYETPFHDHRRTLGAA